MESPEEKRAKEMMEQAEAALNKWSWFSSSSKYEDASALYEKAANNFKVAKNWQKAAECFVHCANMATKTNAPYDAATKYVLAAEAMQRVDPGQSIKYYREAISIFIEMGRFGTAAKQCEVVATMYEKDGNLKEAITYFQQAADYYAGENSHARAGKSLEKVALHSATLSDYEKAYKTFEQLGTQSLESNLLKFNAKKHFLHACFVQLARGDTVAASNSIDRFSELDYTFRESAECKLLENLTESVKEMDSHKFADVLYSYDSVRKLDPWETSILLRVKGELGGSSANDEDDLR